MLRLLAAAALSGVLAVPAGSAEPDPKGTVPEDKVKMDPETKRAVDRALKFVAGQQANDGSFGTTAVTGFALLAFMANGHLPNQGEYGKQVAGGVRHLLSIIRDDGYLAGPRGGDMYHHGMAALALTQVYGMTGDPDVKKATKKAVDLIARAQNREGGWRYGPSPSDADISVTIMQVMALRGALDAGLVVPKNTYDREPMAEAIKYIHKCFDPASGGYKYQPHSGRAGYARTAAGVCVLQLCGEYEAANIKKAVAYLRETKDDPSHYWYGHYYAAHALNQVGGEVWEEYYKRMRDKLLAAGAQLDDGSWHDRGRGMRYGPVYETSIAVLILSVPTHYLPIYQK